jgi:hypothetical protein
MTTMISEVYDALREAGATEEKARKAAEAIASYSDRLNRIERRLAILSWQVGVQTAAILLVGAPSIWLLLRVAAKVGAIG